MYTRLIYKTILERLNEERRFIQVLYGPRQVGKTTLMYQVMEQFAGKIFNKIIANSSFSFIIPRISKHKTNFLIGKLKIVLRTFGYKTVQSLRETCIERTYEAIM